MTDSNASPTSLKPVRTRSALKADVTDRTARAIIEAEAESREAKTEKLRRARLKRKALDTAASTRPGLVGTAASRRKRPAMTGHRPRKDAVR